jgi:hypothetical protein
MAHLCLNMVATYSYLCHENLTGINNFLLLWL